MDKIVDSKGAAIDEQILKIVNDNRCDDHRCSRVADLNENATQAILAILAQEVKRVIGEDNARVDNLHLESPAHQKAYKENLWIVNLVKAEQRRKAGLV